PSRACGCRSARGTYRGRPASAGPASRAGPGCRSARGTYTPHASPQQALAPILPRGAGPSRKKRRPPVGCRRADPRLLRRLGEELFAGGGAEHLAGRVRHPRRLHQLPAEHPALLARQLARLAERLLAALVARLALVVGRGAFVEILVALGV